MRNTLLPDKFDDYLRFCRVQDELYLEKSHSVKVESMHSFYEKYPESSVPRFEDKHITLKDIQNFFKKVRMYKRGYETSIKNAKHFDPNKIKDWISSYINFDYAILWLNIVLSILLTIVVFVCIIPNNGTVPYEWWQSIFIYPCCFAGYVLGLYAIEIVAI